MDGDYSVWVQLLLLLVLLLVYLQTTHTEGFQNDNLFEYKTGESLYDEFYANLYDELVYSTHKNDFEVKSILNLANITSNSLLLDIGCGTGHHSSQLAPFVKHITAIDTSKDMIKKCLEYYPSIKNVNFMLGNGLNPVLFKSDSFSHILCLYFTIYYIKDKSTFFRNCYNWLHHQYSTGYLIVHIVDRENFDPVVPPSSPFLFVNPQTYAEKRITKSSVHFEDFKYTADFDFNKSNNQSVFTEKFERNGKVFRKNEHVFYMESEVDIVNLAKSEGFIVQAKIDLLKASYEHQYVYIFTTATGQQQQ
jgi:SAM-dependent methyltransferase